MFVFVSSLTQRNSLFTSIRRTIVCNIYNTVTVYIVMYTVNIIAVLCNRSNMTTFLCTLLLVVKKFTVLPMDSTFWNNSHDRHCCCTIASVETIIKRKQDEPVKDHSILFHFPSKSRVWKYLQHYYSQRCNKHHRAVTNIQATHGTGVVEHCLSLGGLATISSSAIVGMNTVFLLV